VAGKGIAMLEAAGIQVTKNVLRDECRWAQRRFLTSVEHGRPYVILKWARSIDGLLDRRPRTARGVQRISCPASDVFVHRWRSEEQAILVGSRTVLNDDPSLTVRHVQGDGPLRVVLDRNALTPAASKVYDPSGPTLLFTHQRRPELTVEQAVIPLGSEPIPYLLATLHARSIRSVLVEGGHELHQHFLRCGLWDEARIIQGRVRLGQGTPAPVLDQPPAAILSSDIDEIGFHLNPSAPILAGIAFDPSWPW
jgi:diaminohydroxyphosphoribosylaminopyrimidine deaminase/5-amino-6-(5-phosphoribosylamino)uracil reductase